MKNRLTSIVMLICLISGTLNPVFSAADPVYDLDQIMNAQPLTSYYEALSSIPVAIVSQLLGIPPRSSGKNLPVHTNGRQSIPGAAGTDMISTGQLSAPSFDQQFLLPGSMYSSGGDPIRLFADSRVLRWGGGGGIILAFLLLFIVILFRISLPVMGAYIFSIPTACTSAVGIFVVCLTPIPIVVIREYRNSIAYTGGVC